MKKYVIKTLSMGLALSMAIGLAGCGSRTQPSTDTAKTESGTQPQAAAQPAAEKKEPAKFTLWHIWSTDSDGNTAPFKKALEDFKKDHPDIEIEAVGQAPNDYFTKLKVALAANQASDLIYSQALGVLKPFAAGDKLQPLNAFIDKNGTKDKLVGGALDNFTFDGKTYALPTSMAIGVLYCNKELFEKNGIKLPETFKDLTDAVNVFSGKGIAPILVAGKDQWPAMFYYDILGLRAAGLQASKDALDKKASWDQPGFIAAARQLQDLKKSKAFNASMFAMGWDEAQQQFVQGKGAMLYNGSWVSGLIQKDDSPVKGKVVAMKFPVMDGAPGKTTEFFGGSSDCFAMNASVKNQEAAFKAIEGITSAMARESYVAGSGLPAWKISGVDTSKINPLMVQQNDLIKDATGFCLWWDTYLGGAAADIHKQLILQLLAEKITPEEFAKQMQTKVNEAK